MAATYQEQGQGQLQGQGQGQLQGQGQGQGQTQNPGPQPVVVHVHVHMHNEEKQEKQQQQPPPPPVLYDQPHYGYETCHRGPPVFYETPQRSFQYARTLGLPQPRPMYPQNQLPRLVYNNSEPVPVYTSQTPRLVHQEYSPRNAVSGSTEFENGGSDTQVRYVFREARPIERGARSSSLDSGYRYNYLSRRNQTQALARKDDSNHQNHQTSQQETENNTRQSQEDIGPIFRPGVSEKYVRNVRRETVVKPGVRLPNTVSIKTQETSTNSNDQVDRKVYKPLKDVFTDKHDAPVSFELKQPRFPYKFPKAGGLSGSRSMSSLDGKTHDKNEVFEKAKNRTVFKDETTGKTFRIHSMVPIQEEQRVGNSVMRRYRFTDDNNPPVYADSPAIPKNKRNSMPAEMASFRLENSSPAYNLKRETEEAEQLHSILKNAR